jgi:hypothetical protein
MKKGSHWSFFRRIFLIITKTILTSGVFVLSVFLAIGAYRLAYLKGYLNGQKDMQEYLALMYTRKDATSYVIREGVANPTIVITPSVKKVAQGVSWGGVELWEEVNKKRVDYGVNPLRKADDLCTIASIRLNQLLDLGKLDGHEGFGNMSQDRPDLKWIFDKYSTAAEFLAYGGSTPSETVRLWDNTLGHKKLLNGGEFVWGCIYAQNTFAVAITAY